MRKPRVLGKSTCTLNNSPSHKPPTVRNFELPEIPPGEDDGSFERHNRVLKAEFSKPSPNIGNVKQLMEVTFPMRRREILSLGHTKDFRPFNRFPFLQVPDHVCT